LLKALSQPPGWFCPPAGGYRHFRGRCAGVLMTAPAVAAQLASEWRLTPVEIGYLFSAELGAMSLATLPAWWWMSRLDWRRVALCACAVFLVANLISSAVSQYEAESSASSPRWRGHSDDPVHQLRPERNPSRCMPSGCWDSCCWAWWIAGVTGAVCQLRPEGGVPDPRRDHALLSAAGPGISFALSADVRHFPPAARDRAVT
jgi:hypothetical protein